MIYKTLSATALLLSTTSVECTFTNFLDGGATPTNPSRFNRIRGVSPVAHFTSTYFDVHYVQSVDGSYDFESSNLPQIISPLDVEAGEGFGISARYRGDKTTGDMFFVGETSAQIGDAGSVYIYRGEFPAWSIAQTLNPPDEFAEDSFYGAALDVDYSNIRRLAVGCKNCNSSHTGGGTVYVYESTTPDARKWRQTGSMTTSSDLYKLGGYDVEISRDIIIADVDDGLSEDSSTSNIVIFSQKGKGPKWDQVQTLSVSYNFTDADIFEDTIVIGAATADYNSGATSAGSVSVFYPSTDEFHLKPKGKPVPVQWSVQQVLFAPTPTTDNLYGAAVAIEGNRMIVSDSAPSVYVYEREQVYGKWSLQQAITVEGVPNAIELHGSNFVVSEASDYELFSESPGWDCLIVSVEDHFGDGWDTAKLTVNVPGGEEDYFAPRCNLPNPLQFRYCPSSLSDEGLYRFSIPDAVKAKNFWEIIWRVYEEKTGTWYTGNWDTKMDFHWDATQEEFTHRKIEHELPNNITCKFCKNRPSSTRLRHLKGKDSTAAPTISPAPTVEVDDDANAPWQWLTMEGDVEWFDAQHKGTSYYISDSKAHRLLSVGTMCPGEGTSKACWEDYPDGEYILRVGGALSAYSDDHDFSFCKSANQLASKGQMIFRVDNGECSIVSYFTSSGYCKNEVDLVQFADASFDVVGLGSFGTAEKQHFAEAIATVFNEYVHASNVQVTSVGTSTGGHTKVTVAIGVSGNLAGVDFLDVDEVDTFESSFRSKLSSKQTDLLNALRSESSKTGLHSITGLTFMNMELSGSKEVNLVTMDGPDRVTDMADTTSEDYHASSSQPDYMSYVAVAGYSALVVAIVLVGVFVVVGSRSASAADHKSLPSEPLDVEVQAVPALTSTVETTPETGKRGGKTLTLKDLQELVESEEEALKAMLGNSPAI